MGAHGARGLVEVDRERRVREEPLRTPVAVDREPLALEDEPAARGQTADGGERARWRADPARAEIRRERGPVRVARDASAREQRLRLGREDERAVATRVVERLLTEAVAREDEATARPVPDGDGEHALERIDEVRPSLLVEVRDDLGVAARA